MTCSQLFEGPKCESQTENSGKTRSRGMLPGSQHFRGVEGGVLKLRDGTRKSDKQFSYSLESTSNQLTRWLILCWSTFGPRTSHGRLWTRKTHHGPDSGEATTFPHIVFSTPLHGGHIQMAFCLGTPKWESRNSHNWDSHDFGVA
jgi:hypothetical protein